MRRHLSSQSNQENSGPLNLQQQPRRNTIAKKSSSTFSSNNNFSTNANENLIHSLAVTPQPLPINCENNKCFISGVCNCYYDEQVSLPSSLYLNESENDSLYCDIFFKYPADEVIKSRQIMKENENNEKTSQNLIFNMNEDERNMIVPYSLVRGDNFSSQFRTPEKVEEKEDYIDPPKRRELIDTLKKKLEFLQTMEDDEEIIQMWVDQGLLLKK
jgi:hypothetical protein